MGLEICTGHGVWFPNPLAPGSGHPDIFQLGNPTMRMLQAVQTQTSRDHHIGTWQASQGPMTANLVAWCIKSYRQR